ncbi:MAG: hypothetical protein ACPIOQ_32960, partial [Promethearchaeia archaeon]
MERGAAAGRGRAGIRVGAGRAGIRLNVTMTPRLPGEDIRPRPVPVPRDWSQNGGADETASNAAALLDRGIAHQLHEPGARSSGRGRARTPCSSTGRVRAEDLIAGGG